ncbi:GNAT family N-acetyltransferase [Myxococcus sp. K38C18041901]|uniref:GNAT family N-acetyltransferase n=1 Tax=Myxococcus guangdongensis TaxID=2906760 RepID=UPI0020A7BFE6|nr:GNAT family N-acetyltransferase [Myxococcus guangdongensis]MCP3060058.1 GNAT family N-acetyltransferase [Myxococcus guangdongensis]
MKVVETERLVLRRVTHEDAAFILGMLNEPSWLRFIGDRGVRTLEAAHDYIKTVPLTQYAQLGYGLYLVEGRKDGASMGLCGLLKRDALEHPDIGFAFMPAYWNQGYAREAAEAVLRHAREDHAISRIAAIVSKDNVSSIKLLERLGLRFERYMRLPGASEDISLYLTAP